MKIELTYNRPQKKGENCEYTLEVNTAENSNNKLNDAIPVKNWKKGDKFEEKKKKRFKKCKKNCRTAHKNDRKRKKKCVKKCKEKLKTKKEQSDQVVDRMNINVCLR